MQTSTPRNREVRVKGKGCKPFDGFRTFITRIKGDGMFQCYFLFPTFLLYTCITSPSFVNSVSRENMSFFLLLHILSVPVNLGDKVFGFPVEGLPFPSNVSCGSSSLLLTSYLRKGTRFSIVFNYFTSTGLSVENETGMFVFVALKINRKEVTNVK